MSLPVTKSIRGTGVNQASLFNTLPTKSSTAEAAMKPEVETSLTLQNPEQLSCQIPHPNLKVQTLALVVVDGNAQPPKLVLMVFSAFEVKPRKHKLPLKTQALLWYLTTPKRKQVTDVNCFIESPAYVCVNWILTKDSLSFFPSV